MLKNIKQVFLIVLFTTIILPIFSIENYRGSIVIIAGTSCSGKSSVCKELVKLLENSHGIYFDDYFPFYKENPLFKAEQKVIDETIKYASSEKTVVCDTIMRGHEGKELHENALEAYDVTFVLLYCPFEEISQRVETRNKKNLQYYVPCQFVQWLFPNYYKPAKESDLIIGSIDRTTILSLVNNEIDEESFLKTQLLDKELIQDILERLDLEKQERTDLTPVVPYDLIVINDNSRSPEESALEIKSFLLNPRQKSAFLGSTHAS